MRLILHPRNPARAANSKVSFPFMSDTPTVTMKNDYLDFRPYAQALAFLIDQKTNVRPLIVAISAPWGAGKTTLAKLVEEQLGTKGELG